MAIQFLNNVNADSGVLYVDAVNDRVGIGTTSPEEILHIQNTGSDTRIQIISDNTRSSTIFFGDTDDDDAGVIEYHNNSDSMRFFVNASETMRITSVGKVGIGTTSPAYILDVKSSQNNVLRIESTATTGGILFTNSSTTDTVAIQSQGDNLQFRVDNGHINLKTNTGASAVTRMRITNDGEVGIGTTTPGATLEVSSTGNVAAIINSTNTFTFLDFENDGTNRVQIGNISDGEFTIRTADTDRVRVDSSGNVGIGTSSPAEELDVNGTVNLTNLKIATAQGSDGQVLTSTGSGIAWEDVSVSGFLPTTGGTMTGDLKFNDNVYARFGSATNGDLVIGHTNFGNPYNVISSPDGTTPLEIRASNLILESANGETYIDCNFNSSVDLYYNNSKKFETTNAGVSTTGDSIITGDVGIGTTSPSAKLHVNGQNGLIVGDGNETGLSINNGTYIYKIGDIDGGENQSFIEIDSASQKTIFNNTNVGIGTTSPSSLIEMSATLDNTSSKLLRLTRSNQGSSPAKAVGFYSNSGERGSITVSNFATAYNTSSDYRLKENVIPIEDGINRLMSLKPCRFNFISEEQVVDGFLAHEAQNIVPEAISGEKDQIDEDGNEVYQGIDQAKLVPLLTAALQEAIKRIEILEQKNK